MSLRALGDETPEERSGARRKSDKISPKGASVLQEIGQIREELKKWKPARSLPVKTTRHLRTIPIISSSKLLPAATRSVELSTALSHPCSKNRKDPNL